MSAKHDPKWTRARIDMARQLAKEPGGYASYYPPLRWLLEQGFAEVREGRYSDSYRLTDAGRKALGELVALREV